MDTTRAARAHILCTSIALLLVLIASCLTYIFLPKVPGCKICAINASAIASIFRHQLSQEQLLLTACNHTSDSRLIWEDEWEEKRKDDESILDHNKTWIILPKEGVYLVYVQVNFNLQPQKNSTSKVEVKFQVDFDDGDREEIFSAAHDTRVVNENFQDAMLNTFLLMHMNKASNRLSVRAFPSDQLNYQPRPFSTYITIIKWADN
ncbi:uncharacterized protein LOC796870 [Danio rerio]|uniref:Si:dkey-220k22.3 n=1 Tax=Danio rerio TaxID=7955 RepID=A2CEV3_DANRE|nr:uncharacterized protein LOC796870 [Danio rerio]|eukprot:NP_001313532.1 si:dkey-220k22.3 [Danio rerio]